MCPSQPLPRRKSKVSFRNLQYETFDQLYDYCYHVASVVGLICIRIFGYRDPRAEKLAEETGVAFQLTNILRDVKEDAGMGRVYLPREDFARFGIDVHALTNGSAREALRPVLEFEALRARDFYRAAEELLPLVDEDSQPALWTLVEIYRRLAGENRCPQLRCILRAGAAEYCRKAERHGPGFCDLHDRCEDNRQRQTVAIIGGGLAGLSAGSALADAGYQVECLRAPSVSRRTSIIVRASRHWRGG